MFTNILVPTDGSELSLKAASAAVKLAKATGARITAFYVADPYTVPVRTEDGTTVRRIPTPEEYATQASKEAHQYLDAVKSVASAGGVECSGSYVAASEPAEAIAEAAATYRCDGIVLGSHGRSGIKKLILGSVAQKVLTTTTLPVVVIR